MGFQRIDRISEQVRRDIDAIIREELEDPRIDGTWSITRADVTRDLSYAKVYVSVFEEEKQKPLLEALKHASGFIRKSLMKRMLIRHAPQLIFIHDKNIEYGAYISNVLSKSISNPVNNEEDND